MFRLLLILCLNLLNSKFDNAQPRQLVKMHYYGLTPFDGHILPFAVLNKIQELSSNTRQGRNMKMQQPVVHHQQKPKQHLSTTSTPRNINSMFTTSQRQQSEKRDMMPPHHHRHLQQSRVNSKHFKFFDNDGEYLMSLKYHLHNEHNDQVNYMAPNDKNGAAAALTKWPLERDQSKRSSKHQLRQKSQKTSESLKFVKHLWLQL